MADLGMLLDDLELLGGEPAGFSQDGVGDAELADVVQLGGESQQLAVARVLSGARGEDGAVAAHSLDVPGRLVIPEVRRQRQAVDRLLLGEAEIVVGQL